MDLSKIFRKGINPTKMGGQAVMEGIMMRGETKSALAVRLPDGTIKVETEDIKQQQQPGNYPESQVRPAQQEMQGEGDDEHEHQEAGRGRKHHNTGDSAG